MDYEFKKQKAFVLKKKRSLGETPMTVFTLGICMCESVGQDSSYGHEESHLIHDM